MADLLFLAVMVALLGASALFIRACDHIIGADDDAIIGSDAAEPAESDEAVVHQ